MNYSQDIVIHRAAIGFPVAKSRWNFKHWGIPKTHVKARGSSVQCSVGEIEFYYKDNLVKSLYVMKRGERERFMAKCLKDCQNLPGEKYFLWKPKTREVAPKNKARYEKPLDRARLTMLAKVRERVYTMEAGEHYFTELAVNSKNYSALWHMARRASKYSNGARVFKTNYETMSIERLT